MMTDRTFLGGIGRIDIYYRHASNGSFVVYELPELIKTPRKMRASLSLLNRSPLPYALKIFKGDDRRSVFGFRNHFLGDAMVNVPSESGFPFADLFKMPLGAWSVTSLKIGFDGIKLDPDLLDAIARETNSCRINSYVLDTEIYTENRSSIDSRSFWSINHNSQIECFVSIDQVDLTSGTVHPVGMVVADTNGHYESAFESQQGHSIKPFPRHDTLVIGHSPIQIKFWLDGLISFVGFNCLGDGSDRHLCRQIILLSNLIIDCLLQLDFVGTVQLERSPRDVIASMVKLMHGLMEGLSLLWGSFNLDHESLHHYIEEIAL